MPQHYNQSITSNTTAKSSKTHNTMSRRSIEELKQNPSSIEYPTIPGTLTTKASARDTNTIQYRLSKARKEELEKNQRRTFKASTNTLSRRRISEIQKLVEEVSHLLKEVERNPRRAAEKPTLRRGRRRSSTNDLDKNSYHQKTSRAYLYGGTFGRLVDKRDRRRQLPRESSHRRRTKRRSSSSELQDFRSINTKPPSLHSTKRP